MSIVMTSGRQRCTASRAASPAEAVAMTWMSGSARSICRRKSCTTGETSTIKSVIIGRSLAERLDSDKPLHLFEEITLVEAALHQIGIGSDLDAAFTVRGRGERRHQYDR